MDRGLASPGSSRGANVLLVTVDTLRQDRVGAYGKQRALTPNIDRLATGGVRYTHAFTPVPLTLGTRAPVDTRPPVSSCNDNPLAGFVPAESDR